MYKDSTIYKCVNCDYESKWRSNVTRHMIRKHDAPKVTVSAPKVTVLAPKVTDLENIQNNDTIIECNQCEKCNKVFSRKNILIKHQEKCQGILNPLQCEHCMKIFAYKSNKSQHKKICKIKEKQNNEMVIFGTNEINNIEVVEPTQLTQSSIPSSSTPLTQVQNAESIINNNTINNTTNNVVNQIIVFDPVNMELLNDHISKQDIRKMVNNADFVKVLTDYSQALLGRTENQCVRKTNLRSSSSAIHIGNDKWEYHSDKQILPKLLANIATNFSTMTQDHKIKILKQLDDFIVGVTCEGEDYHEDKEEEATLRSRFKSTSNNIKHVLFNLTKQQK